MFRLIAEVPDGAYSERLYALHVVLGTMLGFQLDVKIVDSRCDDVRIRSTEDGRYIDVADCFFPRHLQAPFASSALPTVPLDSMQLPASIIEKPFRETVPILYGRASAQGRYIEQREGGIWLGLDVFGSSFFMLSRYEEEVLGHRDEHGRFLWGQSILSAADLIDRPIVDEYVFILLALIRVVWPAAPARSRRYELHLSHDVDRLFSVVGRSWVDVIRATAGDVAIRRNLGLAARRLAARAGATFGSWRLEPDNTFDYIMGISERFGCTSSFYFIADGSDRRWDGDYVLQDPRVRALLRSIHDRGHEIGLHGSYRSFENASLLRGEYRLLLDVAGQLGIRQAAWGGRQHYLRWSANTWRVWDESGLDYDSTLGFADRAGFRCGTCHEYEAFDLQAGRALRVLERPLVAMDVTLLSVQYMGLSLEQCLARTTELQEACRFFGGAFTLLWHNTSLTSARERDLYRQIVSVAS